METKRVIESGRVITMRALEISKYYTLLVLAIPYAIDSI